MASASFVISNKPNMKKNKQGRKRNARLDAAAEWMKANLGSSLHHGLINGGFKESEASSKNYRDQLSRRLRNDRRAMEEGVLENDLVVNKLKVRNVGVKSEDVMGDLQVLLKIVGLLVLID